MISSHPLVYQVSMCNHEPRVYTNMTTAGELKGKFDRVICDPPFLSTDCQTKGTYTGRVAVSSIVKGCWHWLRAAITVRWLSKPQVAGNTNGVRIVVCTGERMGSLIPKVYPNTRTTTFEPKHTQGRLSNEFRCFANYECNMWKWRWSSSIYSYRLIGFQLFLVARVLLGSMST